MSSMVEWVFSPIIEPSREIFKTLTTGAKIMSNRAKAERIIRSHVLWAMGAGLMPLPLFDIAAVTAIQIDMLQQLSTLHNADFTKSMGKSFVAALTGTTFAKVGASMIKAIPGIGTLIGGLSMSVLSGASTYAIGQVATAHFEGQRSLSDFDVKQARAAYEEAFERGKEFVVGLKEKETESQDVFQTLEKLGKLRDAGVISEEEFAEQKRKLLERI